MKKILSFKSIQGYALIFIMIGASLFFGQKEIILPEMAALAVGCLIYEHPGWVAKPFHIFLLPSITAVGGFLINKLDIGMAPKLILALSFIWIVLLLFKSSLAPALATGLLPVITNATSVSFILAIVVLTFILYQGLRFKKGEPQVVTNSGGHKPKDNILYLAFLSVWILICSRNGWMFIAAIPPVIVVGYESVHKKDYTLKMFYKQVICLFLAAYIGTQSLYFLNNLLLAALVDIILVTLTLRLLSFKLPPAYAMALLPMVLHNSTSHKYFHWQVLTMATLVLGIVCLYKNIKLKDQLFAGFLQKSR
jgi:hypothetical protein